MSKEKTKNEIVKPSNQVSRGGTGVMVPEVEGLQMNDLAQYLPYLVLIQRENPLKEEMPGIKDGDIVSNDGTKLPDPLEVQVLYGKTVFLEKEIKLDKAGNLDSMAPTMGVLNNSDYLELQNTWVGNITGDDVGNVSYFADPSGKLVRVFQSSIIMLVLVDKLPYQISFRSITKQASVKKMLADIYRQRERLGKTHLYEIVMNLKSRKKQTGSGINYFVFDSMYSRLATADEIEAGQKYSGTQIEVENISEHD